MHKTITALADLAAATAAYESAWRASTVAGLPEGAYRMAGDDMYAAYNEQVDAQSALAAELGVDTAAAITGALIQAAARTNGTRPDHHAVSGSIAAFIRDCINGEAGV